MFLCSTNTGTDTAATYGNYSKYFDTYEHVSPSPFTPIPLRPCISLCYVLDIFVAKCYL